MAVATLGGPGGAGVEEVATALGKEPRQLAVAHDRLLHKHGLLEVPERAKVCFVDGEMADWVAGRPGGATTTAIVQKGPAPSEGQHRGRPGSSPSRDAQLSQRRRPTAGGPKTSAADPLAPGPTPARVVRATPSCWAAPAQQECLHKN